MNLSFAQTTIPRIVSDRWMRGLCQDGYEVKLTLGNSDILVAFALAGYIERKLVYLQRVLIKENILLEYADLHWVIASGLPIQKIE